MPTEDAYSSGHLVLSFSGLAFVRLVETSVTLYRLDIIPVFITEHDIFTESDILPDIGFHRASATGVACRQGTLTPPDTWSCPTLGLACVLMSRPISPELVLSPDFWISNTPRYFSFAFALFAVAEGWLLLDIGWFVLFLFSRTAWWILMKLGMHHVEKWFRSV